MADMPSKPPIVFPQEQRVLTAMGERIRLAPSPARRLSTTTVSGRAGISRSTLHKIEAGDPGVTLGSCVRVLACLSLVNDFDHIEPMTGWAENCRIWGSNRRRGPNARYDHGRAALPPVAKSHSKKFL